MPHKAVSYGPCPEALLHDCVVAITDAGDAVTFGRTSEGGAYYVGVLADGQLEKFYLADVDLLVECLQGLADIGHALVV